MDFSHKTAEKGIIICKFMYKLEAGYVFCAMNVLSWCLVVLRNDN